jgi:hypothetical protein
MTIQELHHLFENIVAEWEQHIEAVKTTYSVADYIEENFLTMGFCRYARWKYDVDIYPGSCDTFQDYLKRYQTNSANYNYLVETADDISHREYNYRERIIKCLRNRLNIGHMILDELSHKMLSIQ